MPLRELRCWVGSVWIIFLVCIYLRDSVLPIVTLGCFGKAAMWSHSYDEAMCAARDTLRRSSGRMAAYNRVIIFSEGTE